MQSRLLKWMQAKYRLSNRKAQRKLMLVKKQKRRRECRNVCVVFVT
ncbi:Uncharacterised protein [Budvicia aquatica]|nr:Uncharacterised protein [Budvicia aquatica]